MKAILNVVSVVLVFMMVGLFSGCGISKDTFLYWNGSDKLVQSESCEITLAAPVIPAEAKIITIKEDIMFLFDSAEVTADEMDKIKLIADLMNANPDLDIVVDAYASEEGPADYNMDLSQRRADSVQAELVKLGVDESRIVSVGQGETGVFGEILGMNRRAVVVNLK